MSVNSGNGSYASPAYTTTAAGTYRWVASYSGDANNNPVSGACNDDNELVVVEKAVPGISTAASGPIDVGGNISDVATLSGGYGPTGTITFKLYGPNDDQCVTEISSESVTVSGNGDYASPSFTPTQPGTYRWVASYSGDANNDAVSGNCNDDGESVLVSRPEISLTKTPSATSVAPGTVVTFTFVVTNTGDIALGNVVLTDDKCSPLVGPSGDVGGDQVLDPQESWTYTCSTAIGVTTTNVATVSASDSNDGRVNADASATVTVEPPVVAQATPSVDLPVLEQCISRTLKISPQYSNGSPVKGVLYIDGKRKKTVTKSSPTFRVAIGKYKAGTHKIRAVFTYSDGSVVTVRGTFDKCRARIVKKRKNPGFTG